jgi:hypothetical protein
MAMARLTAEQRAELQRQLDDDAAADDDFEVEITDGERRARVPYSKARKWLGDTFGIDLDDTSQDDDDPEGKPAVRAVKDEPGRRFGGRRVS